jgi:hypothetical protein
MASLGFNLEKIVYALELVQCCQKKAPTLVLKLDFANVFSMDSDNLILIMEAQGFPQSACAGSKQSYAYPNMSYC